MKKYVLMAILLLSGSICFGTGIEYNKNYSTITWRATKVFNGDVEIYESTPAATSNFEIKSGSITKVLNVNVSNDINVSGIVNVSSITAVKQIIFSSSSINSLLWNGDNTIFEDIDNNRLHLSHAHFESYISITSSTSTYPSAGTGHIRLPFNADIQARNDIDSKDLSLLKVNATGGVQLGIGDNAEYMDVVVSSQLIVGGKTEDVGWGQILFRRDNTIMYSTTQFMGADTVSGDNLGNHIATTTLNMSDNYIINVFEIDGFNLETQFLEIANSTNTLVSVQEDTGTLRTDFATLALSTGTLKDYVDLIAESTGTLKTEIITVAEDTGTLRTDLIALALSTGTIIGDNLGNHTATTTLNMSANYILDVSSINFDGGTWFRGDSGKILVEGGDLEIDKVLITPDIEGWNGILNITGQINVSTITFADGTVMTSTVGFGGGTGVGDNLGNHIATVSLNMSNFAIDDVMQISFVGGLELDTIYMNELGLTTATFNTEITQIKLDTGTIQTELSVLSNTVDTATNTIYDIGLATGILNTIDIGLSSWIASVGVDTGTLLTDVNSIFISTGEIQSGLVGISTLTLAIESDLNSVKDDTGTLRTDLTTLAFSTAPIAQIAQIQEDTGTLRSDLDVLALSTGTIIGDNLGNHTATTTLNMSANYILDVSSINFDGGTWFRGDSGKILVEGGDLEIDKVLITPDIEGWNGWLNIDGQVNCSTINIGFGGQINMMNNSIVDVFKVDGYTLDTQFTDIANSTNTLVSVQADTGTIQTELSALSNTVDTATNTIYDIGLATGILNTIDIGLSTWMVSIGVDTGTLNTTDIGISTWLVSVGVNTGTLRTDVNLIAESTGNLRIDLTTLEISTGTLLDKTSAEVTYLYKEGLNSNITVSSITFQDGIYLSSSPFLYLTSGDGTYISTENITTTIFELSSGGDVFIATIGFIPIIGCAAISDANYIVTGIKAYTIIPSTWACAFNVAIGTSTQGTVSAYSYMVSTSSLGMEAGVWISSSSSQTGWIVPDITEILEGQPISLHCVKAPVTGNLPSEYGIKIKGYRRPND